MSPSSHTNPVPLLSQNLLSQEDEGAVGSEERGGEEGGKAAAGQEGGEKAAEAGRCFLPCDLGFR